MSVAALALEKSAAEERTKLTIDMCTYSLVKDSEELIRQEGCLCGQDDGGDRSQDWPISQGFQVRLQRAAGRVAILGFVAFGIGIFRGGAIGESAVDENDLFAVLFACVDDGLVQICITSVADEFVQVDSAVALLVAATRVEPGAAADDGKILLLVVCVVMESVVVVVRVHVGTGKPESRPEREGTTKEKTRGC